MDFDAWLKMGYENGWVGPDVCSTHDGVPMTASEEAEFETVRTMFIEVNIETHLFQSHIVGPFLKPIVPWKAARSTPAIYL
jgi:hypothetical protein